MKTPLVRQLGGGQDGLVHARATGVSVHGKSGSTIKRDLVEILPRVSGVRGGALRKERSDHGGTLLELHVVRRACRAAKRRHDADAVLALGQRRGGNRRNRSTSARRRGGTDSVHAVAVDEIEVSHSCGHGGPCLLGNVWRSVRPNRQRRTTTRTTFLR